MAKLYFTFSQFFASAVQLILKFELQVQTHKLDIYLHGWRTGVNINKRIST